MIGNLLIFLLLSSLTQQQFTLNDYDLILHPHDRGAYCLDGSPAGMYIRQGTGEGKNKFLIYFDGGGFCGQPSLAETIQACYQRSFTELGTTSVYKKKKSFDHHGLLSTKSSENPTFHDWTKIFAIYCDGSVHQGHRQNPINYKGKNLYLRGTKNTLQHFHYLNEKYDFYNKDTIVITGVSAGGMATYQWVEYLYQQTKTSKVYGIPDSGLFLIDFYSPIVDEKVVRVRAEHLLGLVGDDKNELPKPVQECFNEIGDLTNCYDASNYAKYITAPFLMIQSTYDEWVLENLLVIQCLTNRNPPNSIKYCNDTTRAVIEDYREKVIKAIYKIREDKKERGIWGPACIQHGFSDESSFTSAKYEVPTGKGLKIYEAVGKFLANPEEAPWLLDEGQWPSSNTGCNGLRNLVSQ